VFKRIFLLSFSNLCVYMHAQKMKFQRKCSQEYRHVVCIRKTKYTCRLNGIVSPCFIIHCKILLLDECFRTRKSGRLWIAAKEFNIYAILQQSVFCWSEITIEFLSEQCARAPRSRFAFLRISVTSKNRWPRNSSWKDYIEEDFDEGRELSEYFKIAKQVTETLTTFEVV